MIRLTFLLALAFFFPAIKSHASTQARDPVADSLRLVLSRTQPTDTSHINNLLTLANHYSRFVHGQDSTRLLSHEALELARQAHYQKGEAWALVYFGKGMNFNPEVASGYFRKAGELFEQLKMPDGLAYTALQNGVLMYTQNNFAEALHHFLTSKDLYTKLKDETHVARLQHLSGLAYMQLGDASNALLNLQSGLTTYVRLGKTKEAFECRLGLADTYYRSGYYDDALIYYRMCHAYGLKSNITEMAGTSALGMGNVFMKQGKIEEAETAYLSAYSNRIIHMNKWKLLPIADALYRLYEQKGDYQKSFEYLKISRNLLDSLYNEKNMGAMAGLKSERLIAEAEKELLKSRLENESDNRIMVMLAGGLLVLAVVAYGSARRYRLKKKMAMSLEEKNKALNNAVISLKSAEAQLIKAEKMAVFGKLSAGIAHEIRNPLNFITNFSELCQQVADDFVHAESVEEKQEMAQQIKKLVDKIGYHGRRADSIVTRMLQHSRSAHTEAEYTDLNRLADEFSDLAFESMRNLITNFECRVEKQLDPSLRKVWLIPQDISRVIINLLNNAFYSVHDKRHLHLNGYTPTVIIRTHQEEEFVVLTIEDNGGGIPEEAKDKIFEPFFTTKPIGEGTGLGLSICSDIMKAAGGHISVQSTPGTGCVFSVTLPIQDVVIAQKEPQDDLRLA